VGIPAGGRCPSGALGCCAGLSCNIIGGSSTGTCGVPIKFPCQPDRCGVGKHCCPGRPGAPQQEGCCPKAQACTVLPNGNPGCIPRKPLPPSPTPPPPAPRCTKEFPVGCGPNPINGQRWCCPATHPVCLPNIPPPPAGRCGAPPFPTPPVVI
jgi:hypothetical protein